jgi:hypothetical protein
MSTLRVDTIEANAASSVTLAEDTVVSGTLTATGTLTGQGNIVATGNVTAGSGLIGQSLDLNGGNIIDAGTVNCTGVSSSGSVSSGSLSVSGGASVGSLTIGGEAYDQRVRLHALITLGTAKDIQTSGNQYRFTTGDPGFTLTNAVGISSVSITGDTGFQSTIRVNLNPQLLARRFPIFVNYLDSSSNVLPIKPWFNHGSNARVDLFGGWYFFTGFSSVKHIQIAMFG